MRTFMTLLALASASAALATSPKPMFDTAKIEQLTGDKGALS